MSNSFSTIFSGPERLSVSALLLFGPVTGTYGHEALAHAIRFASRNKKDCQWLLDIVQDFPNVHDTIINSLDIEALHKSSNNDAASRGLLEDLAHAFATGSPLPTDVALSNKVIVPTVVACQLLQYQKFVQDAAFATSAANGPNLNSDPFAVVSAQESQTLGFCVGLLAAFAAATSANRIQFRRNASAALYLALLIGIVLDAEESASGTQVKSIAVEWSNEIGQDQLLHLLEKLPGGHLSVWFDENRATVVVPTTSVPLFQRQLSAAGLSGTHLNFTGSFHDATKQANGTLAALLKFCDLHPIFQLPDARNTRIPTRANTGGLILRRGKLHHHALKAILVDQAQWLRTMRTVRSSFLQQQREAAVVGFGCRTDRSLPQSLQNDFNPYLVTDWMNPSVLSSSASSTNDDQDIAIVGMAIKTAGANDVNEFWELLNSGKSTHQEVPESRFGFAPSAFRAADDKRKWYGNFVNGHDEFDHKFFKKTPRESASMDPQQRVLMHIAYQAVEQSGYFLAPSSADRLNVGCFIGATACDYESNLACHEPNAFTATGHLKGFIAGKVSHYFGWTGPGVTIDTACSSSAVAIHQACRSILSGECNAALAAGSHIMSSPVWFQNLAGASFLSPTGQCKPFDAKADGYCRGEAVGAVFLKKMSDAIADSNPILGVIRATAVQQNENCTPIFVPNVPSLSDLFRRVITEARVDPSDVSLVEAHGTGTAVGDPAEYSSVKAVLGGKSRKPLVLGSSKGHVGHTECSAGIVSLIKVLLSMHKGVIPPQASFDTINPAIKANSSDGIVIATTPQEWDVSPGQLRMALVNNYGASGSNAAMIIAEPPPACKAPKLPHKQIAGTSYPFWLSGVDEKSLARYAGVLSRFIQRLPYSSPSLLADLSFNLSRQRNPALNRALIFKASSLDQLRDDLADYERGQSPLTSTVCRASRPVVFCFGGQVSTFIGLNRSLYDSVTLFRRHLDAVDAVVQSLGVGSIYPGIFDKIPGDDPVKIQVMLFACQYACARTWMDSGVQPVTLLGHSFGELTALCVSEALHMNDALKLIIRRATLIRDVWGGADKGSMLAVEGDLRDVEDLIRRANNSPRVAGASKASIACYNGPRSFTLAGNTDAIDAVQGMATPSMRVKRLAVTNSFHCHLVDPLLELLEEECRDLTFRRPKIPIERATESKNTLHAQAPLLDAKFVPGHLRNPVYFSNAVQRIAQEHPGAIYLEAGTSSSITVMAARALPADCGKSHFQPMNVTVDKAWDNLVDTVLSLWKAGMPAQHWAHSHLDKAPTMLLPPYQFEASRHWLDLQMLAPGGAAVSDNQNVAPVEPAKIPDEMVLFESEEKTKTTHVTRFLINTLAPQYRRFVDGHLIAGTASICPATVQLNLVVDAMKVLQPNFVEAGLQPQFNEIENKSPICINSARQPWIEMVEETSGRGPHTWDFQILTSDKENKSAKPTVHTTGRLILAHANDTTVQSAFSRLDRFTSYQQCQALLQSVEVDDILLKRNIYKMFDEIVVYCDDYRGVHKIVGKDYQSAGIVAVNQELNKDAWFDAYLADSLCQIAGIFLNCMTDREPSEMIICTGMEQWTRSPFVALDPKTASRPHTLHVIANHHLQTDSSTGKAVLSDVFAFDASTGRLAEVILGVGWARVPMASMRKILTRLTETSAVTQPATSQLSLLNVADTVAQPDPGQKSVGNRPPLPSLDTTVGDICRRAQPLQGDTPKVNGHATIPDAASQPHAAESQPVPAPAPAPVENKGSSGAYDIVPQIKAVLAELSGLEEEEISQDSALADLGIDSLMGMELIKELEKTFKTELPDDRFLEVQTFSELLEVMSDLLGISHGNSASATEPAVQSGLSVATEPLSSHNQMPYQRQPAYQEPEETDTVSELTMSDNGDNSSCSERQPGTPFTSITSVESRYALSRKESVTWDLPDDTKNGATLSFGAVMEVFNEIKHATDQKVEACGQSHYYDHAYPMQTAMCVALTVEAFEQVGCSLRRVAMGQPVTRVPCPPGLSKLVDVLYGMLEKEARVVNLLGDGTILRTHVPLPSKSSRQYLAELQSRFPDQNVATNLTFYAGSRLADILTGKLDGIKLLFGTSEGKEMMAEYYAEWPLNRMLYGQLEELLVGLATKLRGTREPLRITELGAGTGGTTRSLLPTVASLGIPVEYTFTDLAPSLVAAARKKYQAQYPWMRFHTQDIEKAPAAGSPLIGTQHIVIATNAVHATHSLVQSTRNIHQMLRPDGFLAMVEMTAQPCPYWVDLVFGLFEGWWLFDDGRKHALTPTDRWERDLHTAGYGHVDWTDGLCPSSGIERLILAMADPNARSDRMCVSPSCYTPTTPGFDDLAVSDEQQQQQQQSTDIEIRHKVVSDYVQSLAKGWRRRSRQIPAFPPPRLPQGKCVVLTGATGSLGCHLAESFALRHDVRRVICLNRRRRGSGATTRQYHALSNKCITLDAAARAKITVLEAQLGQPRLGLMADDYEDLVNYTTHICHNAWLMNMSKPLAYFEPQMHMMRNLLDFAADISQRRGPGQSVSFQFVSSIATVGHWPLWTGQAVVPEEPMIIESVLPTGYADAKYVCELLLDETLRKAPDSYRAMSVRLGQIAGSSNGYWNHMEHVPFLLKSSQTIGALPDLKGPMSWTPVDAIAASLADILLQEDKQPYPVYHIDNPIRQPWKEVLPILADAMGLKDIIPFDEWVQRVKDYSPSTATNLISVSDNPAALLIDFLAGNFARMSCGGLLLDTAKSQEHSPTMRSVGPYPEALIRSFVRRWQEIGFLKSRT